MRDTHTQPPPVSGLDEPTVLASPRSAVRAALVGKSGVAARGRLLIVRGDEAAGWFFDLIGVGHELALVDPSTARITEAMPR